MKKLGIILTAAAVLFAFAVPAFATNATYSGEFTFGAMTPFDAPKGAIGFSNMYTDVSLAVDDYNTILFELAGSLAFTQELMLVTPDPASPIGVDIAQGAVFKVPYFQLETDLGKALGLPVELKSTAGLTSLYSSKYEVTGHAYERTLVRSWIDPLAWKFEVGTDMATVDFGLGFGEGADTLNDLGVLVTVPEVGPASVEAWYLAQDNADYKGKVGFDVKATDLVNGMLSVAAGFMDDTAMETWAYGVGASVVYEPATLGVSLNGTDTDTVNQLGIDLDAMLTDIYGATAAVGLSLADGMDTFQGADLSVYAKAGAATWRVGYVITDGNGYTYGCAVGGPDGGLYVNADIDF
jgi:hypothetical protein